MSIEEYIKEGAFGPIAGLFYDYQLAYELGDLSVVAWPEKYISSSYNDTSQPLNDVLIGTREIVRDLSWCLEINFADVYALETQEEGWESWSWDAARVPKLGVGKHAKCNYPILRVTNSKWLETVVPEWNRDWMNEISHWRLISSVNSVDICARSAVGKWVEQ